MDLWAWCIQEPRGPWNGVGLSPVSVIGQCEQARSPYTPRAGGKNRDVLLQEGYSAAVWCFSTTGSLARRTRPNCDPSRSVLAWPLRHRPLLDGAGYVPLRREFEQGFLDGHGPAQVGLGPPFGGPHRLRLSQQHLRLTPGAGPGRQPPCRPGPARPGFHNRAERVGPSASWPRPARGWVR
jgi:hypothetical protein